MKIPSHDFSRMKEWYERYERRFSVISLVTGFVLDSLTLQRIDALRENLWIFFNLTLVAICIVLINKQENEGADKPEEVRTHFWLSNIMQFGFGALLGTFFVFYFRSATLMASWPFLLALVLAMVANELFQKRYVRLAFQISFLYLSLFFFAIFLVPVVIKRIGAMPFFISGVLSLLVLWLFVLILKRFANERFRDSKTILTRSVAGIFVVINILYFTNIIPPIPLSLKDAGVYHSISRASDESYLATGEDRGFLQKFFLRENFHHQSGEPAYVYSAVFSPTDLNTRIVHEWQYKDEDTDRWVTASRISLAVSGGRAEGFRTYSMKSNLFPAVWRVNVATPRGQLIGRVSFRVVSSPLTPPLRVFVKD